MNELKKKYLEFMQLEKCKVKYILDDGKKIEFIFKEESFPHLIGLHKLKDIQLIQFWLDRTNRTVKLKTVLNHIKNESLTDSIIKSSMFYSEIQDRYENFSYKNLTTLSYTDVVINFNPKIIKSKLKSDYILFEEKNNGKYNHMAIALDKKTGKRYIETFFNESSNKYIHNQKIEKVKSFYLYDKNNKLIVNDSF